MLTSKVFGSCTSDYRKAIADFIKYICINEIEFQNNATSLKTFIASRLVPLDKNPGLRPIGVGEVPRRQFGIGKAVAGQDAGCEVAVNSMHDIFRTKKTEAVSLVDAENAFSSIDRQVFCITSNI